MRFVASTTHSFRILPLAACLALAAFLAGCDSAGVSPDDAAAPGAAPGAAASSEMSAEEQAFLKRLEEGSGMVVLKKSEYDRFAPATSTSGTETASAPDGCVEKPIQAGGLGLVCVSTGFLDVYGVQYKQVAIEDIYRFEKRQEKTIGISATTTRGDGVVLQNDSVSAQDVASVELEFVAVYPAEDTFSYNHRAAFTKGPFGLATDVIERSFTF